MEKTNAYSDDDMTFSKAMQLANTLVLPMAMRTTVELGIFEIMAASGKDFLSSTEIVSQISTRNPEAPAMVERILRFLASSSVLKCETSKIPNGKRLLYGLTPTCKYYVKDKDGVSQAPLLLMLQDKAIITAGYHLKDAIVDGGSAFTKAHGMTGFEYASKDQKFNNLFNEAMRGLTKIIMNKLLDVYKGFEGITQIVDVGGGTGANLAAIISKYPDIKGVNYDLPHVINDATTCPGVEHLAGNMFESVPSGDAIFLKHILHDWSDDECLKLLRNCWKALPKSGKVIVLESLLPQIPDNDDISNNIFCYDMSMLVWSVGAKERTQKEFDVLARRAGFATTEVICNVNGKYVFEFHKL